MDWTRRSERGGDVRRRPVAPIWTADALDELRQSVLLRRAHREEGVLIGERRAADAAVVTELARVSGQGSGTSLDRDALLRLITRLRHEDAPRTVLGWYGSRVGGELAPNETAMLEELFGRGDGVAVVIDPYAVTASVYAWADGGVVRLRHGALAMLITPERAVARHSEAPPSPRRAIVALILAGLIGGALAWLTVGQPHLATTAPPDSGASHRVR